MTRKDAALTRSVYHTVRQLSSLNESHKSSQKYTPQTDLAVVFAANNSCLLSPETTEGPYCA